MNYTLILGILFCYSAAAVAIREIQFRPENVDYPKAPAWLRAIMFGYAVVLAIIGSSALFSLSNGRPWLTEGPLVFVAAGTAVYNSGLLVNARMQKFGPRVHSRIQQIIDLARCREDQQKARAAATEEVRQHGATVAPPLAEKLQLPPPQV